MAPDAQRLIARFPRRLRPLGGVEPLGQNGGLSGSLIWRYQTPSGRLALKRWPAPTTTAQLTRVHAWMSQARGLPFVPQVQADDQAQTLFTHDGAIWDLCSWMPGQAAPDEVPGRERCIAALRALGALHARWRDETATGASEALSQRRQAVIDLIEGGFDALQATLSAGTWLADRDAPERHLKRGRALASALLEHLDNWRGRPLRLQPCVVDMRPEHILFEGDRVTGIVDYGAMRRDIVAVDLARLLGEWGVLGRPDLRAIALEAYQETAGPRDSTPMSLIDLLDRSAALVAGCRWIAWAERGADHRIAVARLRAATKRLDGRRR